MSLSDQLDAMLETSGGRLGRMMNHYGLTLAKVTNIKDDKNFNRVKCLPIGAKDEEETDWCYVMSPMGGKGTGLFLFPQLGDLVVLAYLDDDPHRPLVLGSFWNTESTPPLSVKDGKNQDYCLRTPEKTEFLLHDESGKQKLTVTMPSGTVLVLDDEKQAVSVKDKSGDNALLMDLKKGEVTLKAKTKLVLSAGETSVTLEQSGNITEKGSGTLKLDAANIEGKAKAKLALKGATGEVKADGSLTLSASGPASVKGAVVKIN